MASKEETGRWRKLESGQALVEYWPTIPIAIAILVSSGIIVNWLRTAYLTTIDGMQRAGIPSEICNTTEEEESGSDLSNLGPHTIELIAVNYNPDDNTTMVTYRVSSNDDPSISHWTLGLDRAFESRLQYVTPGEAYEWTDSDPTTGVGGIKFDTGYESSGDGEGGGGEGGPPGGGPPGDGSEEESGEVENEDETGGGPPGGGPPGGGPPGGGPPGRGSSPDSVTVVVEFSHRTPRYSTPSRVSMPLLPSRFMSTESGSTELSAGPTSDTREISMLLTGQYEFETTTVAVKAGTEVYTSTITAPTRYVETSPDTDELYSGC